MFADWQPQEVEFETTIANAFFKVTEKATGKSYIAQLKALDDSLSMYISLHNVMDSEDLIQLHEAIVPTDNTKLAVLIFEK
ncbi:hypothetical protein M3Y98_00502000 [Aphelenchoides besseyi]|nr:hypothetical protein M3Y98_00502000 [Aphelenchoides besseyi]